MASKLRQLGQGVTEYIIIVALIAIAAIAIYGFFGDTIRAQMGAMTKELAGHDGGKDPAAGVVKKVDSEKESKTLSDYTQ